MLPRAADLKPRSLTPRLRLFEAAPELLRDLTEKQRELAERRVVVPIETWRVGPMGAPTGDGGLGVLLVQGLVRRRTQVVERSGARRTGIELLGSGDVLRPHEELESRPIDYKSSWDVLLEARGAVIDAETTALLGQIPGVLPQLFASMVRRSRYLSLQMAIGRMRGVEDRVVTMLWLLAARWGSRHGVETRIDLPLSHETLGDLIGAARPSVTLAVGRLRESGALGREGGGWVLYGRRPVHLGDPAAHPVGSFTSNGGQG